MGISRCILLIVALVCTNHKFVNAGEKDGNGVTGHKKPEEPALTREILNTWISEYFKCFEKIKKTVGEDDLKTMDIMEKMIIQCWITTLQPDVSLVKEFVPGDESATTAAIKENLVKTLKDIGQPEAEKALLYYTHSLHGTIRDKIVEEGTGKMDAKESADTETHDFLVHTLFTPKMLMQSYIFDFIREPYGDTFVFKYEGKDIIVEVGNYIKTNYKEFF